MDLLKKYQNLVLKFANTKIGRQYLELPDKPVFRIDRSRAHWLIKDDRAQAQYLCYPKYSQKLLTGLRLLDIAKSYKLSLGQDINALLNYLNIWRRPALYPQIYLATKTWQESGSADNTSDMPAFLRASNGGSSAPNFSAYNDGTERSAVITFDTASPGFAVGDVTAAKITLKASLNQSGTGYIYPYKGNLTWTEASGPTWAQMDTIDVDYDSTNTSIGAQTLNTVYDMGGQACLDAILGTFFNGTHKGILHRVGAQPDDHSVYGPDQTTNGPKLTITYTAAAVTGQNFFFNFI